MTVEVGGRIYPARRGLSRRRFLGQAPREMLDYLASLWRGEVSWYEVVQDMRDLSLWHVNLFAATRLGDIRRGRLIHHRRVRANSAQEFWGTLGYPLRIQYCDGRSEQDF